MTRSPHSALRTPNSSTGLTLVEVLMSMFVMSIGVLSIIVLWPIAFARAVQATNLTNATILRYNAESQIDYNPRLLLRWQANQTYQVNDVVVVPNFATVAFKYTNLVGGASSGPVAPNWNTIIGQTTNDGSVVWTSIANPPQIFVIDPLGWNTLGNPLQTNLGNNGGVVDPNAVLRFNGELATAASAAQQVALPDSWGEQARGAATNPLPVPGGGPSAYTSVDLLNVNLAGNALPATIASRAVLIDATGKVAETRLITSVTAIAGGSRINWSASDPLTPGFLPMQIRVETQEARYTYMLTVRPSEGGGSSNVNVTVFFHRPLVQSDEQVYHTLATNNAQGLPADGVQVPFTVNYGGLPKPFAKKGNYLFDCYFGRWYRMTDIRNDTGTQFDVYVDRARPLDDLVQPNSATFGVVFMRGIVDVFPLTPK